MKGNKLNKDTSRGDKPQGVGRHFKNKQYSRDSRNENKRLDSQNKREDISKRNLQNEQSADNSQVKSLAEYSNESVQNKRAKHKHKSHKSDVKFDLSKDKSNQNGDETNHYNNRKNKRDADQENAPAETRKNTGFLEKKAKRQQQKTDSDNHSKSNHAYNRQGQQHNKSKVFVYGALDLGTNNCRLLLAKPQRRGFRVVDSFSRIIRLGEGLGKSNNLSEEAMDRTIEALKVCSEKMAYRGVHKSRLIATEACRRALNGAEFIHRVHAETGLKLEIIEQKTEAQLAVAGCAALLDEHSNYALVFDIGGGSSELILVEISPKFDKHHAHKIEKSPFHTNYRIVDWTSLPIGVVTLSEKFGGRNVTHSIMAEMMTYVDNLLAPFELKHNIAQKIKDEKIHLLGTSGTVTTVAGIHLKLEQYDRRRIDGFWLESALTIGVTDKLIDMEFEGRANHPCIGPERADLVLAGCAIFNAIYKRWPAERTRVADRGLREGILTNLMSKDLRKSKHDNSNM